MQTNISTQTVEQAIQQFYDKYDFGDDGGINHKWAWIKFGFFSIPIPNVEGRSKVLYIHDINHLVTENDTTWQGESAVSAWEIGSGGWGQHYIAWLLTLWAMGLGVLFYPKSVLNSFRKGLTMQNILNCGLTKSEILKLSLPDLQKLLSNKPSNNTNPFTWMAISFTVFISPFVIVLLSVWTVFKCFIFENDQFSVDNFGEICTQSTSPQN
ncbi:MAG: hypothetical protein U5M51_05140 [Emticicia sp.]|nr:hypothetical protein [Emticicia sp.]